MCLLLAQTRQRVGDIQGQLVSQGRRSLTMWPWASHLPSLGLTSLVMKREIWTRLGVETFSRGPCSLTAASRVEMCLSGAPGKL